MLNALKNLLGFGPKVDYSELVKQGAIILDVRSKGEYAGGHIKGSMNISVDQLQNNLGKLKDKNKPIINYYDRLEIVKSCRYVDEIYENADLITTDDILIKLKADFVFAGNENPEYLKKYYQVSSDKLILLSRTENISTSKIKNLLKF